MASIRREILINANAASVWDALRDFYAVHRRLAPGFVVDLKAEPGARVLTFANGAVARELLVSCDDAERRLVYAIAGGRLVAHSASAQVLPEGENRCRFVWITDFLPDDFSGYIQSQMEAGAAIMKKTLEAAD